MRILVGPDYDHLVPLRVNDGEQPHWIHSQHFQGLLTVRVRDYEHGVVAPATMRNGASSSVVAPHPEASAVSLESLSLTSDEHADIRRQRDAYFTGRKRYFSLQWQGCYAATKKAEDGTLEPWTAEDIWFTNEIEHGISLPRVAGIALNIARFLDPSFCTTDIGAVSRPWAGSRMFGSVNMMRAGNRLDISASKDAVRDAIRREWPSTGVVEGTLVPAEDTSATAESIGKPGDPLDKAVHALAKKLARRRRQRFQSTKERAAFQLDPARTYACEFISEHLDAWHMVMRAGFRIGIGPILNNQPYRLVCRAQDRKAIFFVVQIDYADVS
ncbi:hypothetical protein THASP1DRAFT_26471 [Thamnocephalis sphaerospora]|uniref:Domain of unknown function at the cortex 1 domain-containing protein n=1 Tax=Thamnocephalis sphaerospora TaxID=78915 RepID=A0A4P9XH54_9FUNG|nr:hypothetical protein THASP1DRAFT_26471 [Thamnocephalis sphaerospora]|eukprot:RKP04972.1 hypothetical protein THASP1DRAFT_26471 [Thamnocephalis sphaerospora]